MENIKRLQISRRQLIILGITSVSTTGHLITVSVLIGRAGRDAWLAWFITLILAVGVLWVIARLGEIYPGENLISIISRILPRPFGFLLGLAYVVFFLLALAVLLRTVTAFMVIGVLPDVPVWFVIVSFAFLGFYGVRKGVEAFLRVAEILFPLLIFFGIAASLRTMSEKDYHELLPILGAGWEPVFWGSLVTLGFFGELIGLTMYYPFLEERTKLFRLNLAILLATGVFFIGPITGVIAVFGLEQVLNLTFPTFSQLRSISIIGFVERIDSLAIFLMLAGSYVKIASIFYACNLAVATLFPLKANNIFLNITIAVGVSLMSMFIFYNYLALQYFVHNNYFKFGLLFGVVTPCLLLLIWWLKKIYSSRW